MAAKKRIVRFFEPYRRQPDATTVQLDQNFWADFRDKLTPLSYDDQLLTIRGFEYRGAARHELSTASDYFYLCKTREQVDFPESSIGDADEAPLTLQEGARLVEPCYFVVAEPPNNTIALIRSSAGPSVSAVGDWVTRHYQGPLGHDVIELQPKLRGDQSTRFNDAVNITRFEVAIERHHNLGEVTADTQLGAALRGSYEGLERGALVEQVWSFGHNQPNASLGQDMKQAVIEVLNWGVAKLAKATVVRTRPDGSEFRDKIDFVKDQITTRVRVGDDPTVSQSPEVVVSALREAVHEYIAMDLDGA
ncbi:hypothetical protein ONA92_15180 [Mycobacteroides salmoniphilum]|uniref:hypothetical protein n=1 Tax=Mycobacteroides salmoniphilum TaxID=404941 RepID=UPI003563B641